MPNDHATTFETAQGGFVSRLVDTARDIRGLVADHLELAAIEAQRAANGLVRVLVVTIVAAILLVAAWSALVVGIALWATDAGLSPAMACMLAAAANVVVAAVMLFWLSRRVPEILFAATLRQLRRTMSVEEEHHA